MYLFSSDLILFQRSTNKQVGLFQHSFSAAMSNVVVSLVRRFVLIVLNSSCFPTITSHGQHWPTKLTTPIKMSLH